MGLRLGGILYQVSLVEFMNASCRGWDYFIFILNEMNLGNHMEGVAAPHK